MFRKHLLLFCLLLAGAQPLYAQQAEPERPPVLEYSSEIPTSRTAYILSALASASIGVASAGMRGAVWVLTLMATQRILDLSNSWIEHYFLELPMFVWAPVTFGIGLQFAYHQSGKIILSQRSVAEKCKALLGVLGKSAVVPFPLLSSKP